MRVRDSRLEFNKLYNIDSRLSLNFALAIGLSDLMFMVLNSKLDSGDMKASLVGYYICSTSLKYL